MNKVVGAKELVEMALERYHGENGIDDSYLNYLEVKGTSFTFGDFDRVIRISIDAVFCMDEGESIWYRICVMFDLHNMSPEVISYENISI